MELQNYLKLQNGTDVRGVAVDGVDDEPVTLTAQIAQNISHAFGVWLANKLGKPTVTVAIGHDSRISAPILNEAAAQGLEEGGFHVVTTGLSTTPSMFALLTDDVRQKKIPCDGSIMLTASHLPFNRNGLKFFTLQGGVESSDVKEILQLAYTLQREKSAKNTVQRVHAPYLDDYAAGLVEKVRKATNEEKPLLGKRIVVDAGNGAGGFFVEKVLQPLGADTAGSQFLEPDGYFPNHIPNPENKDAMRAICEAVKKANADFGIIFDTDVDRAGAVDNQGNEINRNRLIALISAILLKEKPGTIVTDSVTSDGLAEFIKNHGGRHHRFKRGYKNVINEAIRLNKNGEYTPLAIETSGHAALIENYFLDDGAYLMTRLLIALANAAKEGKNLTDLIADLKMPKEELELRLRFKEGFDHKTNGVVILERADEYFQTKQGVSIAPNNYEGCRICFDKDNGDGWMLLRMSLHDPILPINIESNRQGGSQIILKHLAEFLSAFDCLDFTPLQTALNA